VKFKYGQRVKVKSGFFEGQAGHLLDHQKIEVRMNNQYSNGYAAQSLTRDEYLVSLELVSAPKWICEREIEPQPNPDSVDGVPV